MCSMTRPAARNAIGCKLREQVSNYIYIYIFIFTGKQRIMTISRPPIIDLKLNPIYNYWAEIKSTVSCLANLCSLHIHTLCYFCYFSVPSVS